MGTKSDAKTSGWGTTWEQRVGRIITGQILWGSALGDCTREEKQRGVVWGESKGGTHYGENLYRGDIIGECMGARGDEGFVNGFVYYSGQLAGSWNFLAPHLSGSVQSANWDQK